MDGWWEHTDDIFFFCPCSAYRMYTVHRWMASFVSLQWVYCNLSSLAPCVDAVLHILTPIVSFQTVFAELQESKTMGKWLCSSSATTLEHWTKRISPPSIQSFLCVFFCVFVFLVRSLSFSDALASSLVGFMADSVASSSRFYFIFFCFLVVLSTSSSSRRHHHRTTTESMAAVHIIGPTTAHCKNNQRTYWISHSQSTHIYGVLGVRGSERASQTRERARERERERKRLSREVTTWQPVCG